MNRFVSLCLLSFVVAITAYAQEQKPIDLSGTWNVDGAELAIKHTGNNVEARLATGKNYCIGSSARGFQSIITQDSPPCGQWAGKERGLRTSE